MEKYAFKAKVKPGFETEYKKRHDEIWPELVAEISKAGISDYTIYLDEETGSIFGVQLRTDKNAADSLSNTEIMKKWWKYNKDIMVSNPDGTPVVIELKKVFHMD